jgi:DNA-binding NtrC family response regulator
MKSSDERSLILIVDDEEAMAMLLAERLKWISNDYIVETANTGEEALEKVIESSYTLVIADYKMPGLSGLDLAQALQKLTPETQVVLMTAYATAEIREAVNYMGLSGYLSGYLEKPFALEEVQEIVDRAIGEIKTSRAKSEENYRIEEPKLAPSTSNRVRERMDQLLNTAGVWCVLLLGPSGYPVETVGDTSEIDVADVSKLASANFASSYHQGKDYNVYLHNLNDKFLLAVVFDATIKPGMVQFYTRQAASDLVPWLSQK